MLRKTSSHLQHPGKRSWHKEEKLGVEACAGPHPQRQMCRNLGLHCRRRTSLEKSETLSSEGEASVSAEHFDGMHTLLIHPKGNCLRSQAMG